MSKNILEIKNLNIVYKTDIEEVFAVNGIDFSLEKGEALGIVGETGAGKTTTAMSIMRILPERTGNIRSGEILFNGRDILKMSDHEIRLVRGKKISIIFQDPMTSLNPLYTIEEQIAEAIRIHNVNRWDKQQIDNRVEQVLSLVGISADRKKEYPHQFSGGMKQRVVIAIALVCEPDLIIADEPTTALDVTIQAQVLFMIKELRDRLGTSMIMITHNLGIVAQTCDKVAVMYAGELVEKGTAEDIFNGKIHHPYTEGLFGSIPDLRTKQKRLNPIKGLMPDPSKQVKGCRFAPRCSHCMEICMEEHPMYYKYGTHMVMCHIYNNTCEFATVKE